MVPEICKKPWKFAVQPFRIVNRLYYVGNASVSSYLIDSGDGLILLDTGYPQTLYLLLESIRRLGFDPDDIKLVIHSHGHYDHIGGTRAIKELTGARAAMGEPDARMIVESPELTWAPEYGLEFYEAFETELPLTDGQVIEMGHVTVRCVHTPGHTDGCFSFFFDILWDDHVLTVGTFGGPGLNTLTDEYLARYGLPQTRRIQYLNSLERLRKERVDVFIGVHPDQNRTFRKLQRWAGLSNPFVDPAEWQRFLDLLERAARRLFSKSEVVRND
ncbi:MAG: MBL fold metallo-hydrolase [Armatimonadota bacterium]|nr:MBL fold metallo-hydrolase [Armatimonadota bacterium]